MMRIWRDSFEESLLWPRFEFLTLRTFPIDVYESEDKLFYVIEAMIPGFKPEELHITVLGSTLTITAIKEEKLEKERYLRRERFLDEMTRTFTLPTEVEIEKIEAVFEHGVLKLFIPKTEEVKPKEIPIKVKELAGVH